MVNCEGCETKAEIKNEVVQLMLVDGRALCATCIGGAVLFPLLLFPGKCHHGMKQRHLCYPCQSDEDRLNEAMCLAESQ